MLQCIKLRKKTWQSITRMRYWVSKLPLVVPTRPPNPGPVTGRSGRLDFFGSVRAFSRARFLLGSSRNKGSACGLCTTGFAWKSWSDFFLGARATHTRAPLSLIAGSYKTWVAPSFLSPVVAKICKWCKVSHWERDLTSIAKRERGVFQDIASSKPHWTNKTWMAWNIRVRANLIQSRMPNRTHNTVIGRDPNSAHKLQSLLIKENQQPTSVSFFLSWRSSQN